MSTHLLRLQSLLLDLLSPVRPIDLPFMETLGDEDWAQLMRMVRQHRIGPLLSWQANRRGIKLPAQVEEQLAALGRRHAVRPLVLQRELVLVARVLRTAGIPFVALKGSYLAWHVYPEPRLRPLRDIDILVPADAALRAYEVLLENGLARQPGHQGDPASAIGVGRHLPPLRSQSGQVEVELHTLLFDPQPTRPASLDLAATGQFWQRCVTQQVAGEDIVFESPTDLLLHLIVHAVFDHKLNNGPLLLPDLAYLIDRHPIDWPLFWSLAEERGFTRGCVLALRLVERYWGSKPIAWPEPERDTCLAADGQWEMAAGLMLQDSSRRDYVHFNHVVVASGGKAMLARFLLAKVFPARAVVAAIYPVSKDSLLVFLWYPVRWWRILTETLPGYLRSRRPTQQSGEMEHVRQLQDWLSVQP